MLHSPTIQSLNARFTKGITVDVLRLDLIHPIISGNKWYKLRYYLKEAKLQGFQEIASFGGAYSNHLVALAYACKLNGYKSIGFIRGEKGHFPSPTLLAAENFGMELQYLSRSDYQQKALIQNNYHQPNRYWIAEGGYGQLGALGAASLLEGIPNLQYSHIVASVGSGTMTAGLLIAATPAQKIIGISSQKNNPTLANAVTDLVPTNKQQQFRLIEGYHFGGFAKHPPELIHFMQHFWATERIPTDIVYTGKLFYALEDLIKNGFFEDNSKVLVIHSGGLQGNLSLKTGVLPY